MVRLLSSFGPALSLPFTLGVLPAFIIADRYGLWWWVFLEYWLLLVCTGFVRLAEHHYVTGNVDSGTLARKPLLYSFVPVGYLLNLGMMWAQAQSTVEGFGHVQRWEVTPKSGRQLAKHAATLPSYIVGTAFMCMSAIGLFVASLLTGHAIASLFYILTIVGSGWVTTWFMVERLSSIPSSSVSLLKAK
jgi:hypothetical protein